MLVFAGTAPLDPRSLRTQERSGPPKAKSSTNAGKSADAVPDAIRREIASLGQAGNWRGLVAKLRDKNPAVRQQAATALREVLRGVKNKAELKQAIPPLVTATLNDSSEQVREPARVALREVLSRIDDQAALISVIQPLLAGLKHKDQTMRGFCAHELSGIAGKIEDGNVLKSMIGPLNAATLQAENMSEPDFPGFALRTVFRKTDDQAALIPVIQSWLAGLKHNDSTMRAYYAHALHENAGKIKDKAVLVRMVSPLTIASLQVKDSEGEGMSAGDLAYSALKQVLDKVDDQAALKSIVAPMAEALKSDQAKRRRYAAHAVMLFGHKVEDKAALWSLVQPLVAAHFHDPDEAARRSAGLALERTFGRVPEPN
jgi:hypothetical protein